MSFEDLDRLVGGLPPSARTHRSWWGNATTASGGQTLAWLNAGYHVEQVGSATVTFAFGPATSRPRAATATTRAAMILDGVDQLTAVLLRAGYPSVVAAVAEHAVFLHPATVAQVRGSALFPTIRDPTMRGQDATLEDGRRVGLDDNSSPTQAFLWAAGLRRGRDVQFNHVWTDSKNPDTYTALWNVFATPAFLAKTTDTSNHPEVGAALRFRALDLYGHYPANEPEPSEPAGYRDLVWAPHPPPVADLEAVIRVRLKAGPKGRTTMSCRTFGWLFSDWRPDSTI
jgi:hypothetical protein